MTTQFQIRFMPQYLAEIFGNQDIQDPLLTQNLSQKTKFHLKKLGNSLQEEYKQATEQLRELFDKYSEAAEEGKRKIKDDMRETFIKESEELENTYVSISHDEFSEKDFVDKVTSEVVAGKTYYNLIDMLVFERKSAEKSTAPLMEVV